MSSYGGRRGVNVSQYIANLNMVPSTDDMLESPTNVEDELALFTNNVDWDATSGFGQSSAPFDINFEQPTTTAGADISEPKLDFDLNGKLSNISPFLYFSLFLSVSLTLSL
jgi:hypothetical protein